ncbi:MAG: acetoacetate--CoA ligase [Pseudonocardia sp.]|nr:acetoacetate--CoA ligase [Pseudonocardia sp.]
MTLTHTAPSPDSTGGTQLAAFRALCEQRAGRSLADPAALHAFSVEQAPVFWRAVLDWSGVPWSGTADEVILGEDVESARFFPGVTLNYAEALLRPLPGLDDESPALTSLHHDRPAERLTRRELREAVGRTSAALAALDVTAGDRVVVIGPNGLHAAVTVLATAALGGTVSTATPDVGVEALLGRFEQVDPVLLVLDRAGVPGDADAVTAALLAGLPTVRRIVLLDGLPLPTGLAVPVDRLTELDDAAAGAPRPEWPRLPFDHPLFVMFSSGTTGPPKAMVHGAGGTLLEHLKEHRLHGDLRAGETLYFHTTTAWMMWNWQLSALAAGAHVVLYDGAIDGPETLWELVAANGVTVFGTSPGYLQLCQDAGYRPAEAVDLSRLRSVLSTGAVLHDWQFDWLAEAVGPLPLQSISGGTDIIGCFVLGHPDLPVRPGRCQSRSLGLDVAAVDVNGQEVVGAVGELVCRRPFPSRPVGFLRDADGSRFHDAYFADHPGVWTHGDLVEFAPDGSARVHGRSDGVLNIDGIRIGPGEIYRTLHRVPEIADCMAVEQRDPEGPGRSRMVLLVVLAPGAALDSDLDRSLRLTLRTENSAAHVPSRIVAVPDLPVTHNGKRSERAARDAVNGDAVANEAALRNPGCLAEIRTAVLGDVAATAGPDSPALADADDLRLVGLIWQDVLGLSGVEPEDDFFDFGGTSRATMDLLRRVKAELGADVPIQEFMRRPTVLGLAAAATAARTTARQGVPLLRAGVGRPLHFVADAWGQLNSFHTLIARLDTERPVYGLNPPTDQAGGDKRPVADVVAEAVTLLRATQPEGPYSLAGFSYGGLVAYEMACRLRAEGADVTYVGLIDVFPPVGALTPAEWRARRWAGRLATLRSDQALTKAGRHLRRFTGRSVEIPPDEEDFAETFEAFNAHTLSPYDGMVVYYAAAIGLPVVGNQLAAWRRAAPHLVVTEVPGDHDVILAEPNVSVLAARISATLG